MTLPNQKAQSSDNIVQSEQQLLEKLAWATAVCQNHPRRGPCDSGGVACHECIEDGRILLEKLRSAGLDVTSQIPKTSPTEETKDA